MKFSEKEIQQIENNALTLEKVKAQIALIKTGMLYSNLQKAATIGLGILKLEEKEEQYYSNVFENKRNSLSLIKFVPASGAATRMFAFLFQFLRDYDVNKGSINAYIDKHKDILVFFDGLENFAFFEEVIHKVQTIIPNFNDLSYNERSVEFVKTMLGEDRLNYGSYPKGLLPFHKYKDHESTAFEEHLLEATLYASSKNVANLHFTILKTHFKNFQENFQILKKTIENKTNTTFNIAFSYQNKETETIALTEFNELYTNKNGKLLFRPSGHGALIENLNSLDCDLVFIKNIDNVAVSGLNEKLIHYNKLLAGILIEIQAQVFGFLHLLDSNSATPEDYLSIVSFLESKMNTMIPLEFKNNPLKIREEYLKNKLNRPIRVCAMVKNEGEPGGGPFWVIDDEGNSSLQIIEFAQINIKNKNQKEILENATHFNPTNMVCGIKNYKAEAFDLRQFVDHKASFITMKTQAGEHIKTLERPGLWNGSMAKWNSIFVEVPVSTFNPVKTINDLLKPPHQVS